MSKIIKICLALILLLNSTSFATAQAKSKNSYSSFIAVPKQSHFKTRITRSLYSKKRIRARRINNTAYVIPVKKNKSLKKQIKELKATGLFEYIEPDYSLKFDSKYYNSISKVSASTSTTTPTVSTASIDNLEVLPNDTEFNSQYYLRQINATKAWSVTSGKNITVAILDSGIDSNHEDLAGKVRGRAASPSDLVDDIGHGTEVAGIIAANTNNNKGIASIGWDTEILSLRITDDNGQARVSTVVSALDDAYKSGAKIIQISLSTNQYSRVLKSAIEKAQSRGLLVVSTSGNTGKEEIRYPAGFEGVIGVGSVDQSNHIESYSTTGEHVGLVAPGTAVLTTNPSSTYRKVTGTSFAAPQVTGAAALVWSINPNLTPDEVRNILFSSATDLGSNNKDNDYGYGLLNIEQAIIDAAN